MNNTKSILDSLCCNNASYQLTKEEEKVVFWLIEQLDLTQQKGFEVQIVPIKTLRDLLLITPNINLADTILTFIAQIAKKGIEFKTDIEIDDKPFFGYINWFQSIAITKNEEDEVCCEFIFSKKLKPFLLELQTHIITFNQVHTISVSLADCPF